MRSLRKLIVGITALMLTNCSASFHLKRAIAKDPSIVQSQPIIIDTTVITEIRVSKGSFVIEGDTALLLEQKGVKTEIRVVNDTFWVETTCPPDTIRIQKEILVPKVVYQEKFSNFDLVKLIISLLVIVSLINPLRGLFKPSK